MHTWAWPLPLPQPRLVREERGIVQGDWGDRAYRGREKCKFFYQHAWINFPSFNSFLIRFHRDILQNIFDYLQGQGLFWCLENRFMWSAIHFWHSAGLLTTQATILTTQNRLFRVSVGARKVFPAKRFLLGFTGVSGHTSVTGFRTSSRFLREGEAAIFGNTCN